MAASLFVSMYQVEMLCLPGLVDRCPVRLNGTASRHPNWALQVHPCVGCMHCLVVIEVWLLLASQGAIDPQACWLWSPFATTAEELLCRSQPYGAGLPSAGFGAQQDRPLNVLLMEVVGFVIWHGLKLSTGCTGFGTSWEVQSQPPPIYALPGATQYELQCDLPMAATCAGLGGAQGRPSFEPRLAATNAGPGAT